MIYSLFVAIFSPYTYLVCYEVNPGIRVINPPYNRGSLYGLSDSHVIRNDSSIYVDTLNVMKSEIGESIYSGWM